MAGSFECIGVLGGISSAGRAPALQAGGRRFDPVILHHLSVFLAKAANAKFINAKHSLGECFVLVDLFIHFD